MDGRYTIDEVHEMTVNYSNHKAAVSRLEHLRHNYTIGPKAQTYGTEAAMPKAQGGTPSDQVYEQAHGLLLIDQALEAERDKVAYIDQNTGKVSGNEKRQVLNYLKDGRSYKYISGQLQISETTIRQHIKAIVWDMM